MTNRSYNYDQIFDSTGSLLLPLGYGQTQDWETIERREITSAVSSVDVAFDPTLYDEIEFSIYEARPVNDNAGARLRVSTDSGATFIATNGAYSWAGQRMGPGNATAQGSSSDNKINLEGFDLSRNRAGAQGAFLIHGFGLGNSDLNSVFDYRTTYSIPSNSQYVVGGAVHESTTTVNGLQFWYDNGGVASCIMVLRGRRKKSQTFGATTDWEIVNSQDDISGVASHDVFWADGVYDEIEATISGLSIGTDNTAVDMTLSTDGSTFHTGATDYEWMRVLAHSASPSPTIGGSTGDSKIELHHSAGTGTDEEIDIKIVFKNVSSTDKKKRCRIETEGNSADGLFRVNSGGGILKANNNAIRGFRIDPAGANATFSADRIRVRGRRALATQGLRNSGDGMKFMGEFTVATAGDAFIDVDMRSSVNSQFKSSVDHDFLVVLEGNIGAVDARAWFQILQNGVAQAGTNNYTDVDSSGSNILELIPRTSGSGKRAMSQFIVSGLNASKSVEFSLSGVYFSARNNNLPNTGAIGGHNNALAANTNNGMRIGFTAGDMDDMRVKVWALPKAS